MPVAEKMKEIPKVYLTSFWHMIHIQTSHSHFISPFQVSNLFRLIHGHSRRFETVQGLERSQK